MVYCVVCDVDSTDVRIIQKSQILDLQFYWTEFRFNISEEPKGSTKEMWIDLGLASNKNKTREGVYNFFTKVYRKLRFWVNIVHNS